MASRNTHSCIRDVLDEDVPNSLWPAPAAAFAPSHDLLARAHAGWERFVGSFEEPSDG
ncbi:hypothetical protein OOK31_18315 [Streptomyces sp. NBC_00249]|uniref:hypothetical protein n=1 Tax=Streptomyces sp. NBC_00249 TaxID=2975690 RepID=UPI00224DBA52|nr:hypothetical protein [Streptomyces sp. NBC_00249]MCX5195820.1 hypothetical protein [Streptomyces sp. NBC_00249]